MSESWQQSQSSIITGQPEIRTDTFLVSLCLFNIKMYLLVVYFCFLWFNV